MGIDTGMKNLGICILNKEDILLWDVYSLLDDTVMCQALVCKCKAKWKPGWCGRHYKGDKSSSNEIKQKRCSSYTPFDVACRVIKMMDTMFEENKETIKSVDAIVLELQPKINARAKMISHFIYLKLSEFILKNDLKTKIKFERASYKLKHFKGVRAQKYKNTYANRKKQSIEYTKQILCDNFSRVDNKWSEFFEKLSKADDAADSFLLCWNSV